MLELHGNIERVKCLDEGTVVDGWEESEEGVPRCPRCGALLRPDVVWFGEALPEEIFVAEKRPAGPATSSFRSARHP